MMWNWQRLARFHARNWRELRPGEGLLRGENGRAGCARGGLAPNPLCVQRLGRWSFEPGVREVTAPLVKM